MKLWWRRIRGAAVVGLIWALAWGVVGGAVMEGIVDPHGKILDMWPQTLAIPGFLSGVIFSVVLSLAERRRGFHELSLPRFAAWGAVAGASLGALGVATLALGVLIIVPLTLLGAVSAAGSLALARRADERELLRAGGPIRDDRSE